MPPGRKLALVTSNARKAEEWRNFLRAHGWKLTVLPAQTEALPLLDEFAVVCRDQSRLVLPGTQEDAPWRHLLPVDHLCHIHYWERGGEGDFWARRTGYFDLSQPGEQGGWWDTQFRDARTGRSYIEQSLTRGTKLSARAAALEQLMEHLSSGPRVALHLTVNLSQSVSQTVADNPCFAAVQGTPVGGLLQEALNRGLFFSSARTRPQQWPNQSQGYSARPGHPAQTDAQPGLSEQ